MAYGNEIVIIGNGRKTEGVIDGSSLLPGTVLQIKAGTGLTNGRPTYEPYAPGTDGARPVGPLFVLDINTPNGGTQDDAYADGDWCQVYVPADGDELNMRWATAGTGTGDAVAIGDQGILETGTGLVKATTGSPAQEPFTAMEAVTDTVATGTLVHCIYNGQS